MTKGTLIRSLGLATGLLLALAGSAQAGTAGDVSTFSQPYRLSDSTRVVVQGRAVGASASDARRPAACRFPRARLSLAPHERAVEMRQIALNRRTCSAVFERGVPPKSQRPAPVRKPVSSGARERGGAGAAEVSALANGYTYSGYSRAWYRDARNGRIVNEVQSGADWNASRGCVRANNTWFRNAAHTASGWAEVSRNWSVINTACDYVISSTTAQFRDRSFSGCQGGPRVDAFYKRVRFVGYPDGGINGSKRSWTEPSCKNVLIAYYALYRR